MTLSYTVCNNDSNKNRESILFKYEDDTKVCEKAKQDIRNKIQRHETSNIKLTKTNVKPYIKQQNAET